MTIIPAGSHIAARQPARAPDAGSDRPTDQTPGNSFADLFRKPREVGRPELDNPPATSLPLQVDFRSHAREYRAEISIAEDAIRFDAKPIVAPSKCEGDDSAPLSTAAAAEGQTPPDIDAPLPAASALSQTDRPNDVTDLPAIRDRHGAAVPEPSVAHEGAAGQGAKAVPPAVAAAQSRAAGLIRDAIDLGQASAHRPPENSTTSRAARVPASISLLPDEVIVRVNGLSLTPEERDALLGDVQRLLSQHGLGNRPIRIQSASRRSFEWR
jgi:hypothetical protein